MLEPIFEFFTCLERLTVFTPLGIRFWDPARDAQVLEGLIVTARAQGKPHAVSRAFRTASGVYAFHGLPGLQEVEYPSGTSTPTASPPAVLRFVVEVVDRQRRFLPLVFGVDVPFQGVFPRALLSSPPRSGPPGFYLFSSPTRPVMPSLAVVRTQLEELIGMESRRPAAHALLEVRIPGQPTAYGLADERGCVAVLFPYPAFPAGSTGASPLTFPAAVGPQRWELSISVRYDPAALTVPPGSKIPDLRSICSQAPGVIWSTLVVQPGQAVAELPAELTFGEELVLRTADESALLIGSAASPL